MALRQSRFFHLSRLFSSSSSAAAVPLLWTPPKEELGDASTVEILSWGRSSSDHEDPAFVPTLNPNLDEVRSIALGGIHSTAHIRSGDVFTWGYAGFGALGHSVYHRELLPRLVEGTWMGKVSHLVTSGAHTAAIIDSVCRGYGGFGALGHSVYHRELLPRLVEGTWMGKISHLATSGAHTAAITDSGEFYTWGRDQGDGRLGLGGGGGPGEGGSYATPSRVNALPVPVSADSCGGFFTLALTEDGQLWSWGANSNYELGRGNNATDWRPKPIPSLQDTRIVQIASGGYHSLALTGQVTHPSKVCSISSRRTSGPFCLYFQHAGFFSSRSLLADVENMEPVSSPLTPVIGNGGQTTKGLGPKISTVQAIKKDIRQSPKKVNLVAKLVRGMRVEDALLQLQVLVKRAAKTVYQVIHSARANASHNHGLDPDKLIVAEAFVGKGVYLKRVSYHAKGRSGVMVRPKCRLTVVVRETTPEEESKIAKLRVMNYKKLTRKEKQLVPHQLIEVTPRWSRKKNEEATTSS